MRLKRDGIGNKMVPSFASEAELLQILDVPGRKLVIGVSLSDKPYKTSQLVFRGNLAMARFLMELAQRDHAAIPHYPRPNHHLAGVFLQPFSWLPPT